MADTWNVGDVVRLKSSGPKMTVSYKKDGGSVECVWFDGKDVKHFTFPPAALEQVDPTDG